jgi:hypothetical protein
VTKPAKLLQPANLETPLVACCETPTNSHITPASTAPYTHNYPSKSLRLLFSRCRETFSSTSDQTPSSNTPNLHCPPVSSCRLSARIAHSPLQHAMSRPPRMIPPCKPQATTSGCNNSNTTTTSTCSAPRAPTTIPHLRPS